MGPLFAFDAKLSNVAKSTEAVQFHNLQKGPFLLGRTYASRSRSSDLWVNLSPCAALRLPVKVD